MVPLEPRHYIALHFAGGGGYGHASERSDEAIRQDIEHGYVSAEAAQRDYGLRHGK